MASRFLSTFSAALLSVCSVTAAQQPGGLAPGSLLQRAPAQIRLPQRDIWRTSELTGPAPSNRWWSSLLWDRYSLPVYSDPFSLRARADGLAFGWPHLSVDEEGFRAPHRDSLRLEVPGLQTEATLVSGFSDWTVDLSWPADGGEQLQATMMKGSPYLYFTVPGGAATLVGADHLSDYEFADRTAVLLTAADRHYLVIARGDAAFEAAGRRLAVRTGSSTELTVAVVPAVDEATIELFARHAFSRPGETRTSWRWLKGEGAVEVSFDFGTDSALLTGLYPHQYRRSSQPLAGLAYDTPRGELQLAVTSGFTVRLPFTGVQPALPAGERAAEAAQLLHDYVTGTSRMFGLMPGQTRESDSYADGKSFGRLASLLTIADQLGDTAAADRLLQELKTRLEDWFDAGASPYLYYDPHWGALLASPTSHGHDSELNDHPFHYGYFLQAAASVAERDLEWARTYGPMVDLLIRDTAAGRDDPLFPFLRALDPYTGHGWASGSGRYERGNNLESSSEAVNHAAGVIRWAEATGDAELLELGIFLYASQTDAVWNYWFAAGGNFPDGYDRSAIGILWSDGGAYGTWWTGHPGAIHGINFLPVTSASGYLALDPDFVLENYRQMLANGPGHYWPDIALQYLAFADPQAALEQWSAELPVEFGESRAKTLWYLSSLASHGLPVPVAADFAQSAVQESAAGRTYLVYNPYPDDREVVFADGTRFRVAARSLGELHLEVPDDQTQ